jgi:hypothetical protein
MKLMRKSEKSLARKKNTSIRTSILELVQELSKLTNDDNLVIAAVKNIFGVYEVRLAGAPVPVLLVNTDIPDWDYLDKRRSRKNPR